MRAEECNKLFVVTEAGDSCLSRKKQMDLLEPKMTFSKDFEQLL
jgi:hypothetical protein